MRQAEQVAEALRDMSVTSIISSPAIRAIETAQPLLKIVGVSASISSELGEIEIGPPIRDGVPYRPLIQGEGVIMDCTHNHGESFESFRDRALIGLNNVITNSAESDRIAIYTHAGIKSVLMDHCSSGKVSRVMRTFYGNGSISEVESTESGFKVYRSNDISHLA